MTNMARLDTIDVVRTEGDLVHVLGSQSLSWSRKRLFHTIHEVNNGNIVQEEIYRSNPLAYMLPTVSLIPTMPSMAFFLYSGKESNWVGAGISALTGISLFAASLYYVDKRKFDNPQNNSVYNFQQLNSRDLSIALSEIRLYQGTIDEVERDLGRKLARVDTKKPNTFIRADNDYDLRLKAHLLGADAIVHYQPGSSIGTPVEFFY